MRIPVGANMLVAGTLLARSPSQPASAARAASRHTKMESLRAGRGSIGCECRSEGRGCQRDPPGRPARFRVHGLFCGRDGSQTRNPKPEIRMNAENQKPKNGSPGRLLISSFGHSFGFLVLHFLVLPVCTRHGPIPLLIILKRLLSDHQRTVLSDV